MRAWGARLVDTVRGGAIGVAEIIPGVSGGTIALLVGIYDTLISSAAVMVRAALALFRPSKRLRDWPALRALPWFRLALIAAGMLVAIVAAAAVIEPLIDQFPELTRAFFAGLIVASLAVPIRMVGEPFGLSRIVLVLAVGAGVFLVLGFAPLNQVDPQPWMIISSAALAVCALVLPGVSGSFLLLSLGLYQPTLAAVNDRDFGYLGLFIAGALLGLGSFVVLLQWLLQRARALTLTVMTGLLLGSLRALWPWQTDERVLLTPVIDQLVPALLWAALGVVIVVALMVLEGRPAAQHKR
ncbi:DUF368 domain-containing protein [Pontimonas sp.]|uniref:DUF368 domain-containing protein n=1 Tax=Pontimonas sp. TaxID=2304492 RepID=UPI00286FC254|nr:DUF368 domain-containing protein [Pontimonas sp.]MDR9433862.1 DUF368 domain-containing protein [Pontimonas sp.]